MSALRDIGEGIAFIVKALLGFGGALVVFVSLVSMGAMKLSNEPIPPSLVLFLIGGAVAFFVCMPSRAAEKEKRQEAVQRKMEEILRRGRREN